MVPNRTKIRNRKKTAVYLNAVVVHYNPDLDKIGLKETIGMVLIHAVRVYRSLHQLVEVRLALISVLVSQFLRKNLSVLRNLMGPLLFKLVCSQMA